MLSLIALNIFNPSTNSKKGTRRADALLNTQLGRLPNGEVNGFGQVFGKIEFLTLHRSRKKEWRGSRHLCGCKGCCAGMTEYAATWAMATAAVVVAGAVGAGVLIPGIVGARRLRFAFGTAGFLRRFLTVFHRSVAATGPSAGRRQGEQAKEQEQCGEAVLHKFECEGKSDGGVYRVIGLSFSFSADKNSGHLS